MGILQTLQTLHFHMTDKTGIFKLIGRTTHDLGGVILSEKSSLGKR